MFSVLFVAAILEVSCNLVGNWTRGCVFLISYMRLQLTEQRKQERPDAVNNDEHKGGVHVLCHAKRCRSVASADEAQRQIGH